MHFFVQDCCSLKHKISSNLKYDCAKSGNIIQDHCTYYLIFFLNFDFPSYSSIWNEFRAITKAHRSFSTNHLLLPKFFTPWQQIEVSKVIKKSAYKRKKTLFSFENSFAFFLYCKFKVENENLVDEYNVIIENTKFKSVNGLQFHSRNC